MDMSPRWLRNGVAFLLLTLAAATSMAAGIISTFAGNPIPNGTATNIGSGNYGVAVDSSGDIYVTDTSNHSVRKINHTTGYSTVIAGTGSSGSTGNGGAATSAKLNGPKAVTVDSSGNVYIADTSNHRIRKIDTSGNISIIAGTGTFGYSGDNGAATSAKINSPQGVAVDGSGNIYIGDTSNNRVRKVDTNGVITTVAGNGTAGYLSDNVAATGTRLNSPVASLSTAQAISTLRTPAITVFARSAAAAPSPPSPVLAQQATPATTAPPPAQRFVRRRG